MADRIAKRIQFSPRFALATVASWPAGWGFEKVVGDKLPPSRSRTPAAPMLRRRGKVR
jgi:N-acetylglutamate synthase-like GNAT family acetyltransferase